MQHLASRTSTSSTPCTLTPICPDEIVRFAFVGLSGIVSSSATSSVFSRWITLLTICDGPSLPEPSAR